MSSLTKSDCFIEGHWVPIEKRFNVTNPATGEVLAEVADADRREQLEAATPPQQPQKKLQTMAKSLMDRSRALRSKAPPPLRSASRPPTPPRVGAGGNTRRCQILRALRMDMTKGQQRPS